MKINCTCFLFTFNMTARKLYSCDSHCISPGQCCFNISDLEGILEIIYPKTHIL